MLSRPSAYTSLSKLPMVDDFIEYKVPFWCFRDFCVLLNADLNFNSQNSISRGNLRLFLALTYRLILIPHVKLMEESKWSNFICLSGIFKSGMSAK